MEGHQARSRRLRLSWYLASSTVTIIGLALFRAGLQYPFSLPSPVASRQVAIEPSARSSRPAGRHWLALEQRAAAEAEAAARTPPWELLALQSTGTGGEALSAAPTTARPRTEVITYVVQPGDNVWLISQQFGISLDTVVWANDRLEMDPDLLSIGEELYILPVTGVWHTVKAGDTLSTIAARYKVAPEDILNCGPNGLHEPVTLAPGQKVIVPGGQKPFEPRLVHTAGGTVTVNAKPEPGRFIWPCNGAITQYYHKYHLAIDIGNVAGTPLYAADGGTVILAGPAGGLGNAVRIDHGNGYVTTYGHMRAVLVSVGDYVLRGQRIGEMGSTGISTGPHVHFTVYYYGGAVNPVRYLPR